MPLDSGLRESLQRIADSRESRPGQPAIEERYRWSAPDVIQTETAIIALDDDVTAALEDIAAASALAAGREPALGNPAADDYILSSSAAGSRLWIPKYSVGGGVLSIRSTNVGTQGKQEIYGPPPTGLVADLRGFGVFVPEAFFFNQIVFRIEVQTVIGGSGSTGYWLDPITLTGSGANALFLIRPRYSAMGDSTELALGNLVGGSTGRVRVDITDERPSTLLFLTYGNLLSLTA